MSESDKKNEMSKPEESTPTETIIVAEDSVPNRKILVHLLIKLGYKVISCEDGKKAWEEINNEENSQLVAIISDIMMPNEDGLQLLKRVRESEKFKNIPFVLVTAVSEKEYIFEAKKLNVDGYILKPVSFAKVTKKLNELFPQKQFPKLAG